MLSLRRSTALIMPVFIAALITGCNPAPQATPTPTAVPARTVLTISGSGTTTSVLAALQADFESAQTDYTLQVLPGTGTGGGVTGVMDGTLDIAAMARTPKADETAQGLQYATLGQAGVAFIVHPEVTVTDLTPDQVKAIFFGEITNWQEVGGADLPIAVYVRDEGDTATGALRADLFGDTAFPESAAAVLTSARDMITSVEGTVGAIGFGTWPGIKAAGTSAKPVSISGVNPDEASYPYLTELGIGYVANRADLVKPFVDWLASQPGQVSLQNLGLITAK